MNKISGSTAIKVKDAYDYMTNVEKNIADFFLNNTEEMEFSSKNISSRLFVSEASLSRFAKKCGFKGFREFIYAYEREFHMNARKTRMNFLTKQVVDSYQDLLDKSLKLVDEAQMERILGMLTHAERIFIYGMGSSGIAAQELALRFLNLGLYMEAVTDSHRMKINATMARPKTLIIALSLSGSTAEIQSAVKIASAQKAQVLLITANPSAPLCKACNEVLLVADAKNLRVGITISPQFPILVMADIFFAYYLNQDYGKKSAYHTEALAALQNREAE